jgi:hypothetical protein
MDRAAGWAALPIRQIAVSAYGVPTDFPEADGTIAGHSTMLVIVEATAGAVTGLGYSYADVSTAERIHGLLNRRRQSGRPRWTARAESRYNRACHRYVRPGAGMRHRTAPPMDQRCGRCAATRAAAQRPAGAVPDDAGGGTSRPPRWLPLWRTGRAPHPD